MLRAQVTLRFSKQAHPALDQVTLAMGPKEAVGVVGESGAGKSLLLKTLLGLQPQDATVSGSVQIEGQEYLGAPASSWQRVRGRVVAWLPQEPKAALHPTRTVGSLLAEVVPLEAGAALLSALGLSRRVLKARAHELSGGMAQRVQLALALAQKPKLMLLDEPTTALDPPVAAQTIELLSTLRQQEGLAYLLVSHDFETVAALAERLLVMYAGRVVESGLVADMLRKPKHPYTHGLLRARLDDEAVPLAGAPPSLAALPSGCAFHPRCARASARCQTEVPRLLELQGSVACHHPLIEPGTSQG